ncbi:MAG: 16S rRNA (adenine(1518)-N(6)/adenine(1519)-N(6))-dimethyltransferase RsmA [Chloroflexia bacterium]
MTAVAIPPSDDLDPGTRQLLSRQTVRESLLRLGLRPSRRLGQHFLVEPAVVYHILRAARLQPTDTVLEVGPGLGVLTGELLRRARKVIAVELDRRLGSWLAERFGANPRLELVLADILELDLGRLLDGPYKVVANLPYSITSAVLRHLLEARPAPESLVLMVQWEVARRMVADPPEMSLLALSVQYYACAEIVHRVPAGCFLPPPKVDSAVVALEMLPVTRWGVSPAAFFRVIRAGFRHPRRTLANNLAEALGMSKGEVADILTHLGFACERRPETLSLEEWAGLCRFLEEKGTLSQIPERFPGPSSPMDELRIPSP